MKNEILKNIDKPKELEKLYRSDKLAFKKAFNLVYATHTSHPNFQFWDLRLNFSEDGLIFGNRNELWLVFILTLVAGLIANISNIPGIRGELFFTRNTAFIIIPFLSAYFLKKQAITLKQIVFVAILFLVSAAYINLIPDLPQSSSIKLAYIHLPIFLWTVLGYSYLGNNPLDNEKRINFLKYNGDLIIMVAIIVLSCFLFTAITFGLFQLIGYKIEEFYMKHIAIWAIAGIPIFATYLINNNPNIINKVSPIIAKIFTPLVFINLAVYLITLIYAGKYPYNDRTLLLIYNALLVGVLALIFFSVAESETRTKNNYKTILLLGLSVLTIIVNAIALSAICFRIMELGITPNRIAVLGGNVLIFIHLIFVSYSLLNVLRNKAEAVAIENSIAKYLPVYAIWTGIVAFIFPLLFGFK
jgi:hypothetical protein